jgi:hypothetical protein
MAAPEATMATCSLCHAVLADPNGLCPHHLLVGEPSWADANRMMCDLLHRGIEPPHPPPLPLDDPWWLEPFAARRG